MTMMEGWFEKLWTDDWTMNPAVFSYPTIFRPSDYSIGAIAKSYEFSDPSTLIVHIRQNVYWQNLPPVNGRQFVASDVAYHFNRLFGLGSGLTPSPYYAGIATWQQLISVTVTDKYTVVFKWKVSNPELILETLQSEGSGQLDMEAHEVVETYGDLTNWRHAIGTGPFILQDYVSGSSATLVKNPNYWGYDERYPQNQLPYIDTLRYLIIPDDSTALAALRTGKIDVEDGLSLQTAQAMQKSNPEILQISAPAGGVSIDPRNDVKPFSDIRVRKAMQMAIDLPTIAATYYGGGVDPWPGTLCSNYMGEGWGFPYPQWPQDLKDEYAYNPTAAKQLLADAGYSNGFHTDIVADNTADLEVLQIVKSYFAAIGIIMDIQPMTSTAFVAFVQNSHKQDALAYKNLGGLGFDYEPNKMLTSFQTGFSRGYEMVSDPTYDALVAKAMATTNVSDFKQVFSDVNKYVAEQHFVISVLTPKLFALYQPWLKGYNLQEGATPQDASTGPHQNGFYFARFWIDQALKK